MPRPQRFTWQGTEVYVTNWESTDDAGPFHRGLFFDVVQRAEDADAAVRAARRVLEQLESTLAFVMAAGVTHSEPLIAFELEDDHLSALQFQELPVVAAVRRHLDTERLRAIWDRLEACDPEPRERLDRAIAWYRKGAFEDLVLDRFQSWWIALEALNPLLQAKYNLGTSGPTRPCPSCGADVPGGPVSSGVRFAIERIGGTELWRALSGARNDVTHARRSLSEVVSSVDELLPPLSQAVREAILELLDVPAELRPRFAGHDLRIPREYKHVVGYRFRDLTSAELGIGQDYPRLTLTATGAQRQEVDGRTQERVSPSYQATRDAVAVLSERVEVLVDPDDDEATLESEPPQNQTASTDQGDEEPTT